VGKTLALLSGKGGSGKTTLALSMATMLADCGIKVLLIDCDLSTNGATYFYEAKLPDESNRITSFYDILFNRSKGNYQFIEIAYNFDFVPSISQITKETTNTYSFHPDRCVEWKNFYSRISTEYDIVLFDCQAGYTDVLKIILPAIDINLFVMEADAISSSAIRSLYLKIGDIANDKKVYQLFNKVTEEEYGIYSKLSGGTVFTNIDAIIFDWKIRKAFSIAQVPDMKNSSARYGKQIYDICNILFVDKAIQESLEKFELVIEIHKNTDEQNSLHNKINSIKEERAAINKKRKKSFLNIFLLLNIFLAILCFYLFVDNRFLENILVSFSSKEDILYFLVAGSLPLISIIMSYINVFDITKEERDIYKELESYQKKLQDTMTEKEKILTQLKHSQTYLSDLNDNSLVRKRIY
jgi:cellulose biosynthesis protein BcsQ